jgi:hypothetical protein
VTKKGKSEEKHKPDHGSHADKSPGGDSSLKNDASRQEAPAGVQSVETEDPSLKGASRKEQHELLKQNVQPVKGRRPQAQPAESDTPAGLHATGTKVDKKTR